VTKAAGTPAGARGGISTGRKKGDIKMGATPVRWVRKKKTRLYVRGGFLGEMDRKIQFIKCSTQRNSSSTLTHIPRKRALAGGKRNLNEFLWHISSYSGSRRKKKKNWESSQGLGGPPGEKEYKRSIRRGVNGYKSRPKKVFLSGKREPWTLKGRGTVEIAPPSETLLKKGGGGKPKRI